MTGLIDVDVLLTQMEECYKRRAEEANMTGNRAICVTWNDAVFLIKNTPTVDAIPVEFITEFKEDYCNAKSEKCDIGIANALVELMLCWEDEQEGIEWRNDHERIPSKQQSVDAIPIEWIEKYYANHPFNFVSGMLYDWAIEQAEREKE